MTSLAPERATAQVPAQQDEFVKAMTSIDATLRVAGSMAGSGACRAPGVANRRAGRFGGTSW